MSPQHAPLTAAHETPIFVPGPEGPLLVVLSQPAQAAGRRGVLLCPGGWHGTSTNRNGVLVRLARRLGGNGCTVARFDWHGVGESPGGLDRFELDAPFTGDVTAASEALGQAGVEDLMIVGICFGARSALAAAPAVPGLRGVVLVSFPFPAQQTKSDWRVRKVGWRGAVEVARRPDLWRAAGRVVLRRVKVGGTSGHPLEIDVTPSSFQATLHRLVEKGVTVDLVFGEQDLELVSFGELRRGGFDDYLGRTGGSVEISVVPGDLSSFRSVEAQEGAIEVINQIVTRRSAQ